MTDEKPADETTDAPAQKRKPRLKESLAFDAVVRELEVFPEATALAILELVRMGLTAREE